jgi:hypothetical protein
MGLQHFFNLGPNGAKKGHLGPKRALLGSLGAQKKPNTRPKCVVTMKPILLDQSAAVGTKSGTQRPSNDLWSPQKALFGPNEHF